MNGISNNKHKSTIYQLTTTCVGAEQIKVYWVCGTKSQRSRNNITFYELSHISCGFPNR